MFNVLLRPVWILLHISSIYLLCIILQSVMPVTKRKSSEGTESG